MPPPSPTVTAWELGIRLREARDTAALTAVEAGKRLNMSQNFLSDIEHGKRKVTAAKLEAMTEVYAIEADEAAELRAMLEQSARRGWWSKYSGIFPAEVLRYFGYEHGAESVQTHESLLIPGLLQTEAYAYAIVTSDGPNIRTSEADQRVEVRLRRQQRLTGDDPLRLTAVISEGALRQEVGGRGVLREQLQHLLSMIEEHPGTLEVFVVPFAAGAHGALGGSTFHLLSFATPRLPRVAYQETITSWSVIENRPRVAQYGATYDECINRAESKRASLDLIHRTRKDLG